MILRSEASLADKQDFMQEMKQINNGKEMCGKATNYLTKFERHEKTYENGGVFWPLPKWTHEGFDAKKIETLTPKEDIQQHEILGTCYRVAILHKADKGAQGGERGDNSTVEDKMNNLLKGLERLHKVDSSAPSDEEMSSKESDSSSMSSSDSDSSCDDKKKRKKHRREQKEKKKAKKRKEAAEEGEGEGARKET